jgi:hypothetical protein
MRTSEGELWNLNTLGCGTWQHNSARIYEVRISAFSEGVNQS